MENMLKIQGVPLSELAETYGTPLYIYDQNRIEEQMETYRSYLEQRCAPDSRSCMRPRHSASRRW